MLREMSSVQWLQWKVFMTLRPFQHDEERADVRSAQITTAIWNAQIAKSKNPVFRKIVDFLKVKWGDSSPAELFEPTSPKSEQDKWDDLRAYAEYVGKAE